MPALTMFFDDFLNNFRSSFFNHNHQHAKVALQNLCQTGNVLAYTQDFNQHTRTVGWANTLLMSLYQCGLKENIQLAVVMRNIEFDSLRSMQAMAQKAGQTIEGIQQDRSAPPSPVPLPAHPPPNLMQWTSPHSRGPQSIDSLMLSKPAGYSRTSVSVVARQATYPTDV
ncbi:uncharacterized protein VP01_1343g1 [Puccinia sorghi]|uniref:Retrotransposon gag domain-containing protein n=1 Tax=Puccinia sorghi TaxID=27349 RepID=A0A0L6VMU6_9BASI|nr:uncharacterized protein VP01_1343g1 [Puccinia sorghi]